MPDSGQQVYWHEIPRCPPPWRAADAPTRAETLQRRRRERAVPPPCGRHWGIVLEPYLSPLHGLNMVMRELRVAAVTRDEAAAAVATVSEELNVMTQQFDSQAQSQGGRRVKAETMTQQSSHTALDVREAPLLEVVKVLCAARGLEVTTFSKAELRLKKRIGLADILPRKRLVMAFDRSKPLFVFLTAVAVKRERWRTTTHSKFLSLVAPTSNPVPWRRLLKGTTISFPLNECILAAVQRCHDDYNTDGFPRRKSVRKREKLLLADDSDKDDEQGGEEEEEEEEEDKNTLERTDIDHRCLKPKVREMNANQKRRREEGAEDKNHTDSRHDNSGGDCCSDDTSSLHGDDRSKDDIILGPNPIFTVKDRLNDDPLFETPVAIFRKVSRGLRLKHDWIQRLVSYKERKQLYAMNY